MLLLGVTFLSALRVDHSPVPSGRLTMSSSSLHFSLWNAQLHPHPRPSSVATVDPPRMTAKGLKELASVSHICNRVVKERAETQTSASRVLDSCWVTSIAALTPGPPGCLGAWLAWVSFFPLGSFPLPLHGGLVLWKPQEKELLLPCSPVWGPRARWRGPESVRAQVGLAGI